MKTAQEIISALFADRDSADFIGYAQFWALPQDLIEEVQSSVEISLASARAELDQGIHDLGVLISGGALDDEIELLYGLTSTSRRGAVWTKMRLVDQAAERVRRLENLHADVRCK
jgi:hypothetical protein